MVSPLRVGDPSFSKPHDEARESTELCEQLLVKERTRSTPRNVNSRVLAQQDVIVREGMSLSRFDLKECATDVTVGQESPLGNSASVSHRTPRSSVVTTTSQIVLLVLLSCKVKRKGKKPTISPIHHVSTCMSGSFWIRSDAKNEISYAINCDEVCLARA